MNITESERERFERQVRALEEIETDEPGSPEQRAWLLAIVNEFREAEGGQPVAPESDEVVVVGGPAEQSGPVSWLGSVAAVLDRLGVEWVVAGAVAASTYRVYPRFTSDLDVLVTWHEALIESFESEGYRVKSFADPGETPYLLVLTRADMRVDLVVATVDYQFEAIRRGRGARVLTAEDVIVHKLIAWRPRDRDDVVSILANVATLDHAYVERWAEEWGVTERWKSVCPGREGS